MRSIIISLAFALFSLPSVFCSSTAPSASASSIPERVSAICESPEVLSESMVGENKDVKLTAYSCANVVANNTAANATASPIAALESDVDTGLTKRGYTNVCGATCESLKS